MMETNGCGQTKTPTPEAGVGVELEAERVELSSPERTIEASTGIVFL